MEQKDLLTESQATPKKKAPAIAKVGLWSAVLALSLCCSLLAGCLGVLVGLRMSDASLTLDSIIEQLKANNQDTLPSGQIADACARTVNSVVTVYGQYQENKVSSVSSGVVVAKADDGVGYYVASCCHCVDGYPILSIQTTQGEVYGAEPVGVDFKTDIALLKVKAPDLQVATPRESAPYLGETIIAHGNPLGSVGISTSFGIVSQTEGKVNINGTEQTLIKVDMALNHGNSGGGVFDMNGQLIGIASAKISTSDGVLVEGVGYAIPTSDLLSIISQLKDKGFVENRPFLGINLQNPTSPNGKLIVAESIFEDGVKAGDVIESIKASGLGNVMLELDGLSYIEAISKIKEFIVNAEEGQKVFLDVRRNGFIKTIDITLHFTSLQSTDI